MSQAMIDRPLLDIASYARRGPTGHAGLSDAEIDHIRRTVSRTPEVMVKVLTRGGQDRHAVRRHLSYLNRGGELAFETDDGPMGESRSAASDLLEDWDLDLEEIRPSADLSSGNGRRPPKLVHKVLFSMPPSTPPQKVLAAVRSFAREEFALQHRYAFVLHTDEPHPHVHLVLKAVSEQGVRLNIKKATLRHWRSEFARHLRTLGVPANATERAVRGENRTSNKDGIYRAGLRGDSTFRRARAEAAAKAAPSGELESKALLDTRKKVVSGWREAHRLVEAVNRDLGVEVQRFVREMSPPHTDRQKLREELMFRIRGGHSPSRDAPTKRPDKMR